jgi:hypothetical protein
MRLPFAHLGQPGEVTVTIETVRDAAAVGQLPGTEGFPACTATIACPLRGYQALFGWVQLVRSDDNSSGGAGFDMDPLSLFEDAPAPYAFFGVLPTLFDVPSRDSRTPLAWLAHSFLAWTPLFERPRQVVPVLGFSWGFTIDESESITPRDASELSADDWRAHLPYLRGCYPRWQFGEWPQ